MPASNVNIGINAVIDISHHNMVSDFTAVRKSGVRAIIHKATEGDHFRDKEFTARREMAKAAGLLWGGYHFAGGANVIDQVENYLTYANPREDELICLDFEASNTGRSMTFDQAEEFAEMIHRETGRYPVLYGGSLLREKAQGVGSSLLSNCPLWYARYRDSPIGIPKLWATFTLWQYTDGNAGPEPQTVVGIGNCDRDTYNGPDLSALERAWPLATHAVA